MWTVESLMTRTLATATPDDSVFQATLRMAELKLGCLPVLEGNRLVGIVTSRDLRGAHPNRLLADAMSADVVTVAPGCSIWSAGQLAKRNGLERLVVTDGGVPVGLVTVKALTEAIARHTDGLTGLPGRAPLWQQAAEWMANGREVSFLFLDLDNFGIINKQLGHTHGDRLIQMVADFLSGVMTERDVLCRYGGDEFAIVSLRDEEDARRFGHQIRSTIVGRSAAEAGVRLSISVGIAGGRRQEARSGEYEDVIKNLINLASRASTEAKPRRPMDQVVSVDFG